MKKLLVIIITIIMFGLLSIDNTQSRQTDQLPEISSADEAKTWLKTLYLNRDFELGAIEGDRLASVYPESAEIQALRIISYVRSDRQDEGLEMATGLMDAHPDHKWAWYAKAVALRWKNERRDDALQLIENSLEREPTFSEMMALHIALLNAMGEKEDALDLSEQYLENTDEVSRIMEMRAFMLNAVQNDRDDISMDDVYEYYNEIRAAYPDNLSAYFFPGVYRTNAGDHGKAMSLMQRAAEISTAPDVHNRYWRVILQNDGLTRDEKIEKIENGIQNLTEMRPETADMLMKISDIYNSLNLSEKRGIYADKIFERYPDSPAAEWLIMNKLREFRSANSDAFQEEDKEVLAEYRGMLRDFLDREHFHNLNLKADTYLMLFGSYRNSDDVTAEELRPILEGLVQYNTYNPSIVFAEAPAMYAEKGGDIEYALSLADRGFEEAEQVIEDQKNWGRFDTEEEYMEELERFNATFYSAKGWIHYHAGNLEEAEQNLTEAHQRNQDHRTNLHRLGQLYEALEQPDNAESYYVLGIGSTGMGDNPNEEALKDLYKKTRGSLDGYDVYLEEILAGDRMNRKERILGARHEDPKTAPEFELELMDGTIMHSSEMENKIVAINYWGKWCGPCVAEMPDIQELYEFYREDENVLILTINNDPDKDELQEWLDDHDYTFPVLRDNGYITSAEISAFPTTWFLDRNGNITFTQIGYTSELVEEFSWRIEALRNGE